MSSACKLVVIDGVWNDVCVCVCVCTSRQTGQRKVCACVCSVAVCMCACIHVWLVTDWDKVLCQTVGAYQPTVHASFPDSVLGLNGGSS